LDVFSFPSKVTVLSNVKIKSKVIVALLKLVANRHCYFTTSKDKLGMSWYKHMFSAVLPVWLFEAKCCNFWPFFNSSGIFSILFEKLFDQFNFNVSLADFCTQNDKF